jgi:hypothetical protein
MQMHPENLSIHGLWIGRQLSTVELLCIHSFIEHGHQFVLWAYDDIETPLPSGVVLRDATSIIPREQVFAYTKRNQFGHGKGSYAGFSDIFRYLLLCTYGGWWTDMDVVCLSPLDIESPYVFRTHHDFPVVGNIMKCPQGSELMRRCYEKANATVNADNADWNLPIRILNDAISELGLQSYILNFSNQDSWRYIRTLLFRNPRLPSHWKVLHLVNEEWRRNKIDKNAIPRRSLIGRKIAAYGISAPAGFSARSRNYFRIVFPSNTFVQAYWFFAKIFWKVVRVFKKEKVKAATV